jgi:hypothetical protein
MLKLMTVHYAKTEPNNNLWGDLQFARTPAAMQAAVTAMRNGNGYAKVATVECDEHQDIPANLEHAYKLMQNGVVTDSWTLSPPDGLTPLVKPIYHNQQAYGHRSMSMGDIVEVDGKEYVVATYGFEEIK